MSSPEADRPDQPEPNFLDPRQRAAVVSRAFVQVYAGMLAVAVLAHWFFRSPDSVPVLLRLMPGRLGWVEAALGVGVGVVIVVGQLALRPVLPWLSAFEELMFENLGKPTVQQCLAVAAASSLAEEVLFRGLLQNSTNLILASLIFGAVHYLMWQWALFAMLMGLVLGGMFMVTDGSLLAPVLAHFTVNFLGLLQIARNCPDDAPPPGMPAAPPEPDEQ